MIILDTDHISTLMFADETDQPDAGVLKSKLASLPEGEAAVSAISLEESFRGWLARIAGEPRVEQQIIPYAKLVQLVRFYEEWNIVPFDDAAAREFRTLRALPVRIGTQDLKIASIARIHDATLLTGNSRDFRRVPGLRLDNWLIR